MVRTSPSSRITTPLPVRSVPRIDAVNASSGTSARSATTPSSADLRSKRDLALRRLQRRRESPAGEFGHEVASGDGTLRAACARMQPMLPDSGRRRYEARSDDAMRGSTAICGTIGSCRHAARFAMRPVALLASHAACLSLLARRDAGARPGRALADRTRGLHRTLRRRRARRRRRDRAPRRRRRRHPGARRQRTHAAHRRRVRVAARRDARAGRGRRRSERARERSLRHRHHRRRGERSADAQGGARARAAARATSPAATTARRSSPPRTSATWRSCAS